MINQKRLIETFFSLVKIDSPSGEEENVAKEMVKRLKLLGGKVERDSYGNVIAKFPGTGEVLMLNAHMDTVEPGRNIKPIIKGNRIITDGSTILGADDKAGLSVLLEALTSIKEDQIAHLPLEIVLTKGEEIGLFGAKNLDYSKITAQSGIAFDGDAGVNEVIIAAPGIYTVNATIIGRAAHAGVEPEKGISAIHIAAQVIALLKTGRIDHETTANIGLIEGGSARNAVAERAHFKGEIRSRNQEKLTNHINHFQDIFNTILSNYPEAQLELDINSEADPFGFGENDQIIQRILKIYKKMKIKPKLEPSGGVLDANIFATHGIQAVAVGVGGYELHTTREYLNIKQFVQASKFAQNLIIDK